MASMRLSNGDLDRGPSARVDAGERVGAEAAHNNQFGNANFKRNRFYRDQLTLFCECPPRTGFGFGTDNSELTGMIVQRVSGIIKEVEYLQQNNQSSVE